MIGIYKITSPTKRVYIGQSVDIEKRFYTYNSIYNSRGQIKLNRSFLKYGVDKHKFEILCECEMNELNDKERYYQDLYSAIGKNGLNCLLTKSSDRSGRLSNELRAKMRERNKLGFGNRMDVLKKIVLDIVTGIYYDTEGAASAYNLNKGTLRSRLNGKMLNNTNLIYV